MRQEMPTPQPLPRLPLEDVEGCACFVNSLSLNMNGSERHPLAQFYFTNFASQREGFIKNLFDYFNARVFGNLLPQDLKISFHPQLWDSSGQTLMWLDKHGKRKVEIYLSVRNNENPQRFRNTLIHELCHAAVYLIDGVRERENEGHGVLFHKWGQHVNSLYPDIEKIQQYDNNITYTNFLLICRGCGQIIGQHVVVETKCNECGGDYDFVHIYDPKLDLLFRVIRS